MLNIQYVVIIRKLWKYMKFSFGSCGNIYSFHSETVDKHIALIRKSSGFPQAFPAQIMAKTPNI